MGRIFNGDKVTLPWIQAGAIQKHTIKFPFLSFQLGSQDCAKMEQFSSMADGKRGLMVGQCNFFDLFSLAL